MEAIIPPRHILSIQGLQGFLLTFAPRVLGYDIFKSQGARHEECRDES